MKTQLASLIIVTSLLPCFSANAQSGPSPIAEDRVSGIESRIRSLEAKLKELESAPSPIPSGVIVLFQERNCPKGFIEWVPMRGRYIVGVHPSGDLGGTIGTQLSDREIRMVIPYHQHSLQTNQLGHTHSITANRLVTGAQAAEGGRLAFPDGSVGAATFDRPQVLTDFTGVQGETNAPYVQVLACIHS
jgi:hypothetical protein